MYRVGRMREKFEKGSLVIGTHIRSQDPCMSELLAAVGYDMLWIENEHSNLDKYQTTLHIMAAQAEDAAAVVRLPWNDPVLAKPVLELGVDGVVFPMINSAEEARKAVAACTYPPKGVRGMGPIRSSHYGLVPNEEYVARADEQIFRIMQIEHKDGVDNIEEILAVDGVDAIIVGQFDLSASLGLLPDVYAEKNLAYIKKVFDACRAHGKICGISSEPKEEIVQMWLDMGVDFIFMCYEYDWIRMAAGNALHNMRRLGKENGK